MRSTFGILLALALTALLSSCGKGVEHLLGAQCQLQLTIHTPPYQDAFQGVSVLRLILQEPGKPEQLIEVDPASTGFTLEASPAQGAVVRLLGVGIDGQTVVSSGQSAPFALAPATPAVVDLLFARNGEFTRLGGSLNHARFLHTASAMTDGRVLVFGGAGSGDLDAPGDLQPPEIYDPRTQKVCGGDAPCPSFPGGDLRIGHSASATSQGTVVIFGGRDDQGALVTPFLAYDLHRGDFRTLQNYDPSKVAARAFHAATVFAFDDGSGQGLRERLLLCGGEVDSAGKRAASTSALIFDTTAETFTSTDLKLAHPRFRHTATAFGSDQKQVLVAGGEDPSGLVAAVEAFDGLAFTSPIPSGNGARDSLSAPRLHHAAAALGEGVVILGGDDGIASLDSPELFEDAGELGTGVFPLQVTAASDGHSTRRGQLDAALSSGGVLFAGGERVDGFSHVVLDTAEMLQVAPGVAKASFTGVLPMLTSFAFAGVAELPGGGLLICGGLKETADEVVASDEVWYYNPP